MKNLSQRYFWIFNYKRVIKSQNASTIKFSNEINLRKPTTFERLSLFEEEEDSNSTLIAVRNIGDLANKSFYLNCNYNWELKTDNKDLLCLIPTKK